MSDYNVQFFAIHDKVTDEVLCEYDHKAGTDICWECYDHYGSYSSEVKQSARFNTESEAKYAIGCLESVFSSRGEFTDFEVVSVTRQGELYEEVRTALNEAYGNTLWEYGSDHTLTIAVMDVLSRLGIGLIKEK
jgi:hypothetical protein